MPPHSWYQAYIDAVAQRDQLVVICALLAYSALFITWGIYKLFPKTKGYGLAAIIGGYYASMGALAFYLYISH